MTQPTNKTPRNAMVLSAGLGTRMRPLTDKMPKPLVEVGGKPLIDHVLDRLAQAGVERAVVNVHHFAEQIERHLAARTKPKIVISDERGLLLGTGGAVVKALPQLGHAPFFHINSDTLWVDGVQPNLARLADAFDPAAMDAALLLAPATGSIGYAGRGDYAMAPDGRLRRRGEREVAPFVFAGAAILSPALFKDAPPGEFPLPLLFDRAEGQGRLFGLRLEGLWMHVGTPDAIALAEKAIRASTASCRPAERRRPDVQLRIMTVRRMSRCTRPDAGRVGAKPNVFNIPASAPFLRVLIEALRAGKLVRGFPASDDPLELSRATLYLPTRRACRLAREVFLDGLKTDAAILPRIVALGDLDEDEIAFAEAATGELAEAALALPPAFGALERRLTLAELISKWAATIAPEQGAPLIANTPEAALALADALARLMDDMITRQVPWDNLDRLVPEDLDDYWKQSLAFLKFVQPRWRKFLSEKSAIEAAERRDKLIEAEARRLASSTAPVIAAGSTGSMPATARLLATIANLPHGALVLPGLDMHLDDASWALIAGNADDESHDGAPAAGHAQFAMHALLDRLRIKRSDVAQLAPCAGARMAGVGSLAPGRHHRALEH